MRHNPLRLAPPRRREGSIVGVPIRKIFFPITHDLVHAATVDESRHATDHLEEVTEGRGCRRPKLHVVDVAIEGLAQSVDKFCHAADLLPGASEYRSRRRARGEVEHYLRAAFDSFCVELDQPAQRSAVTRDAAHPE